MQSRKEYLDFLKQWAIRKGLSSDDAEDVLQDARIKYFLRRGVDYLDDDDPQAYLLWLMVKDFVVQLHREISKYCKVNIELVDDMTVYIDISDIEEHLLGQAIMERLREPWRSVALWRIEEGMTWDEIAKILGKSVGGVSVQFRRALEKACEEIGLECRKTRSSRGINSGDANRANLHRRYSNEPIEQTEVDKVGKSSADGEHGSGTKCSNIPHRRSYGTRRGGSKYKSMLIVPDLSGMGCGCSPATDLRSNELDSASRITWFGDGGFPSEGPPVLPVIPVLPGRGCSDCGAPVATVDANEYCKNPPNADCNGIWPWNNDYIYIWRIEVYHCPDGSFYKCTGPIRTDRCCRTNNTSDEPCIPPPHDPTVPTRPLRPCAERAVPTFP